MDGKCGDCGQCNVCDDGFNGKCPRRCASSPQATICSKGNDDSSSSTTTTTATTTTTTTTAATTTTTTPDPLRSVAVTFDIDYAIVQQDVAAFKELVINAAIEKYGMTREEIIAVYLSPGSVVADIVFVSKSAKVSQIVCEKLQL
jgi:hypothetical protein